MHFKSVEEIFSEAWKQAPLEGVVHETTIHQTISDHAGRPVLRDLEINDQSSLASTSDQIHKIFQNAVLPFFDKFRTLDEVFRQSECMKLSDVANFIGQPLPFRRMIIKSLCQDPRYEEYYQSVIDYYRKEDAHAEVRLAETLHLLLMKHAS